MNLGTHNYQIVATEGYYSSGSATVTVSEGSGQQTSQQQTSQQQTSQQQTSQQQTTSQNNNGGSCAPLWGQCGGQGWGGPTCCQSGSCRNFGQWYSQCQ